jgi:hypothetical protein
MVKVLFSNKKVIYFIQNSVYLAKGFLIVGCLEELPLGSGGMYKYYLFLGGFSITMPTWFYLRSIIRLENINRLFSVVGIFS